MRYPPRKVCNKCWSEKTEPFVFSGNGGVVSYTIIHTAPDGFEKATPYAIGLVKLDESPVISGHIIGDVKNIAIGKRVVSVFRKLYEDGKSGIINYGLKFELVE